MQKAVEFFENRRDNKFSRIRVGGNVVKWQNRGKIRNLWSMTKKKADRNFGG